MQPVKNPVFFVIGATGTGKSKVAVRFSEELKSSYGYNHVVVINCDVYQCFDALPICTNKPCTEDMAGISHVFLGFLANDESVSPLPTDASEDDALARSKASKAMKKGEHFNVHAYEQMVAAFVSDYCQQHEDAAVVVCGGTCYYVQALLFPNSLVHESEFAARTSGSDDSVDDGNEWEQLNAIDSDAASRFHPNDSRRLKRMLEIYKRTGQKPSVIFGENTAKLRFDSAALFVVWTHMDRSILNASLDRRVDSMLRRGMVDEVRAFWTECEGNPPRTSLPEAIGCKEFLQYFSEHSSPVISESELVAAVEQVKSSTRRYARQQERWIKNRLVRILQSTIPTKNRRHFIRLRTDPSCELSRDVNNALQVFFRASPEDSFEGITFPLTEEVATTAPVCQETCSVCGLLVYGRGQMEAHLRSKRHRGAVRRLALEKEQRELYGRELPPPKRKRAS